MFEWFVQVLSPETNLTLGMLTTRLLVAVLLGLLIALIYFGSQRRSAGEVFPIAATMSLLTILVAMTTLVIGNNMARAFSLVGVLSIVRFRTVVEDTRDTAFVIFSVVIGMAIGAGDFRVCVAGIPMVTLLAFILHLLEKYSRRLVLERKMEVRIPRECDPEIVFAALFQEYLSTYRLLSVTLTKNTQSIELNYRIRLLHPNALMPFFRAMTSIEGVELVELKDPS